MKKVYILFLGILLWNTNFAQWSDDFESYSAGDLIAESNSDWDTWSSSPGGSEDTAVSDGQANSGTNSLYFFSNSANGGPTDILLPFGGVYTEGTFTLEFSMYVDSMYGAYFNIQGAEIVGTGGTWSQDVFITQDGNISVMHENASVEVLTASYTPETWIKFTFNIDLTNNVWEFLLDDVSIGTYANADNSVSHLNLFPWNGAANGGNGMASFYVDDISFDTSGTVGIEEIETTSFDLYPNPSNGSINIDLKGKASSVNSIEIYDLSGKLVQSTNESLSLSNSRMTYDVSELNSGLYIISIQTDRGPLNRNFSVE